MYNSDVKKIRIKCSSREKDSLEQLFQQILNMTEEQIKEKFPQLMPHQVMDVKDALNRANF